jgi:hypothetical protein
MKTKRITISVSAAVAAKAGRAARAGFVGSVSEYFANLADREPDWVEARAALNEMVAEAGGISPKARKWASAVLGVADTNANSKTVA